MTTETSSAVAFERAEQSDAEVIQQVLDGNTALFELLMRRYNERVYRAARAIVRDDQEAEDVMQQAYVNAFTHLRQFNGHGAVLDVADEDCHQRIAGSRSPPGPGTSLRR